jgi:hypothetical protein
VVEEIGGGKTRMSIESEFPTVEAIEQLAPMGVEEDRTQAVGQIDAILAEGRDQGSLREEPRDDERRARGIAAALATSKAQQCSRRR